jgi:hypothetical protein
MSKGQPKVGLEAVGITGAGEVHWSLGVERLYEEAIRRVNDRAAPKQNQVMSGAPSHSRGDAVRVAEVLVENGLPAIEVVKYNLLLRRSEFERAVSNHFEVIDYIGLGFFLMMSRVVQPLLVAPEAPSHTHKLNQIAARLERQCLFGNEFQSCDYAGVYVLRRKS